MAPPHNAAQRAAMAAHKRHFIPPRSTCPGIHHGSAARNASPCWLALLSVVHMSAVLRPPPRLAALCLPLLNPRRAHQPRCRLVRLNPRRAHQPRCRLVRLNPRRAHQPRCRLVRSRGREDALALHLIQKVRAHHLLTPRIRREHHAIRSRQPASLFPGREVEARNRGLERR